MTKKVFAIDITSWTSSFRYPNIISGFQPTLEVPPLSTILGLINAAAGKYIEHENLEIGYFFKFGAKAVDLETIYQINSKDVKNKDGQKIKVATNDATSNVIRREFLFDNFLRIYLSDESIVDYFRSPKFSLLLGRMNDLATVESISEIELTEIQNANSIRGQIVPMNGNFLPGVIQALPVYFTDEIPRNNLGTIPFSVIGHDVSSIRSEITCWHDASIEKGGIDIYFHEILNLNL
jgi:CRISPR-associated protein Cas5t